MRSRSSGKLSDKFTRMAQLTRQTRGDRSQLVVFLLCEKFWLKTKEFTDDKKSDILTTILSK